MTDSRLHQWLFASLATLACSSYSAEAFAAPPEPAAQPPAQPDNSRALVTITPRVGVAFPGAATPREVSPTKVGFGFAFQFDGMFALHKHFEVGPYLHYSFRPITERGTAPTDGLANHLVSVGAVAKVRFAVSKRSRMRIGAMIGYNRLWQGFENDFFEGNITANGLNIGPAIEWSIDVSRRIAVNVQLAAITQVWGRADLGAIGGVVENGSKQLMPFPPLAFLAVGADFCLGERS
jgi:hypothetical protein